MTCFKFARAAFATLSLLATSALGQTWTALTHQPSFSAGNELLLTDGRVLVQDADNSDWWTLTPDTSGSYTNGTWSKMASTTWGPLYYASQVLKDGRVYVQGGEYNFGSAVWATTGAVYNPSTNSWASINPPSGWSQMGDCASVTLPSGNVMVQDAVNSNIALLNVPGLTWTSPYTTGKADGNDEEGWTLLPNGNVLTVDTKNGTNSEILNTSTAVWSSAGNVPVQLTDASSEEIGPAVLRPDGTVFYFGATKNTAIYNTTTGTWTAGPTFPLNSSGAQLDCADAPACLLPDGNVLVATSPGIYNSGTVFFEINASTNAFQSAPSTPNASGDPSYVCTMLMLPTGQVMQSDFSGNVQVYTPSGSANPAWAPAISSVPSAVSPGSSYTISGTQFNGLSGDSAYGDDEQNETNYPLVKIVNNGTGHVVFCKTSNPSTMGICTGSTTVSTSFAVPSSIGTGASTIYVVCNGLSSAGVAITVGNTGTPTISSISPTTAAVGSTFTLTVNGSNFVNGATVDWNGSPLTTTFVSSAKLTASVPASDTATAGTYPITVVDPNGATSNAVNITVAVLNPTITTISPTGVSVGSSFTLTVNGTNFVSGATVDWNGSPLTTTFVSSTQLTAAVPSSDTATAGTYPITVVNPNGATSNAVNITVSTATNPVPTLLAVTPNIITHGSPATKITLIGSNFVGSSQVLVNGTAIATTYLSGAQLTAIVPASFLTTPGTLSVQVSNPAPGGGTSAAKTVTVR